MQNQNTMEQKIQKSDEKQEYEERIVRILSKDIEGKMKIYPGLTKVKGISWSLSNAICMVLLGSRKMEAENGDI